MQKPGQPLVGLVLVIGFWILAVAAISLGVGLFR